ncbi:MAG: integrase core domain-containing protein [Verrucomicrobiales bacterium]|nr:integrase core domain-containing protein [Verrucomicrobiales bacterium]
MEGIDSQKIGIHGATGSEAAKNRARGRVGKRESRAGSKCLAIEVDSSLSGHRVCRLLDRIVAERGHPKRLLTDNGPEFTSKVLYRWAYEHCVELQFIQPVKPVQNAFVESFNGTMRNECLNKHWFVDLDDAKELIEAWIVDYNTERPHSSLDGMTLGSSRPQLRLRFSLRPMLHLSYGASPYPP